MNEFEKDVQAKSNDAIESGIGFGVSFLFFTIIFFTGVLIKAFG
ncbi:YqzM family protein [Bacillus taeanensis]|uniref:YqzM family protein n=1 Tax=Bacillus taeanensis TaxID=273032 RepID=A0A366XX62_9BACI|nr:YqzM family protein [Bacillus taeanensis]RBW70487.1 YqzM family protein [Bacillus taeanensis]